MGTHENGKKTKQSPEKRSKKDQITIIVGCGIIALALVIGLLMVFVPRWQREADMEELLEALTAPDPQQAVLVDLMPEGGNQYDGAVQRELAGDALTTVQNGLTALLESGFDAAGESGQKSLTDLVLRVRTADGEFLQLYFGESRFYCFEGAVALLFEPDDAVAYGEFYRSLEALIAAA